MIDKSEAKYRDQLVKAVKEDFEARRQERRALELQWKLNVNFLMGNQYVTAGPNGDVMAEDKDFYWQSRNVYNHIAPIIDTRMAKLARVRPKMSVRAAGGEEKDLKAAKIASAVIESTADRIDLNSVITSVTSWSEATGTGFYKMVWDTKAGKKLGEVDGKEVYEGDVSVICVSPFEIFPDSLYREDVEDCKSIIHARAMKVEDVYDLYGVEVSGEDVDIMIFSPSSSPAGSAFEQKSKKDSVIVIERYEKPSKAFPKGRVVTVAGDKLLSVGELPYENGVDGKPTYPFSKQVSIPQVGCFFGTSVIERLIPLQRSFNAVKNRKNEFLSRISMGVLTVEDGSVDAEELAEDGISPGKIIVYRQGSSAPQMMSYGGFPNELGYEEDRLTNEFITVSGVSEISRTSQMPTNVTSGVALQLLIEQDDTRVAVTGEYIRKALKRVAKHIIRLFRQFAVRTRIMRVIGENDKSEIYYFDSTELSSDDVVFDTENDISFTPAQKKSAVFDLLKTGLLTDENGKMDVGTKAKVLEILGFGSVNNVSDLTKLHQAKADNENVEMINGYVDPEEYDDHTLHIDEHLRFILSGEADDKKYGSKAKERLKRHLKKHKEMLKAERLTEIVENLNEQVGA